MAKVQDPHSPEFGQFLSQADLTARFGPNRQAYTAVLAHLQQQGFTLVQGSANRLTLTVRATRSQVEAAFSLRLADYQYGSRAFYANDTDPAVPAGIAPLIQSIVGLNNLALPHANVQTAPATVASPNGAPDPANPLSLATTYNFAGVGAGMTGAGQKLGLLEFDNFIDADLQAWLAHVGLPAGRFYQVSRVPVNGGTPASNGAGTLEVILDLETLMGMAPRASFSVYHAPNGITSFQSLFNAMIGDGDTVISNSWAYCENVTTVADAQSIDSIPAGAAASGISVFTASGDTGSACRDGSANGAPGVVDVPADSPHGTATGGTKLQVDPSTSAYQREAWWNNGGFGVSAGGFFSRPGYQNGFTAAAGRSLPDVVADADPATGIEICQASILVSGLVGGCPGTYIGSGQPFREGGTSLAAPVWAAGIALLNQRLTRPVGNLSTVLYAHAGSTAFHVPSGMTTPNNDFSHVGLGSFNLGRLAAVLAALPAPGLAVTSISPTTGPDSGGTSVTITGTGFNPTAGATTVTFGSNPLSSASCSSSTSCTASSPTGTGMVDVRITTAGQTSVVVSADQFTYLTPGAQNWTRLAPADNPAPRQAPNLAFDAAGNRTVLYGGDNNSDTWTWDRSTWIQQCVPCSLGAADQGAPHTDPGPRLNASMAYDGAHSATVLFGGSCTDTSLCGYANNSWIWDGTAWDRKPPPAGSNQYDRNGGAIAYDEARQKLTLFGGTNGVFQDDTNVWDGSGWIDAQNTSRPSKRAEASMAYFPKTSSIVLFGGYCIGTATACGRSGLSFCNQCFDTWSWDGSTWTLLTPTTISPPARSGAGIVYNASTGVLLLFGGRSCDNSGNNC
ncbi:MAG: protease pro-enzyme activation domain-containing protein, partial [Dehalococcoidia bacterium]